MYEYTWVTDSYHILLMELDSVLKVLHYTGLNANLKGVQRPHQPVIVYAHTLLFFLPLSSENIINDYSSYLILAFTSPLCLTCSVDHVECEEN